MALTRILGSFKDAILAGGTESTFSGSKVSTGSFGRVEGTHIKMGINNNTIFGNKAGDAITTASGSTFIGEDAGGSTTTGPNNIAIGYDALNGGVTTGGDNIAIGRSAGDALTSGTGNIVLGRNAGGATALADNTVIIGTGAGTGVMTDAADGTVLIGYTAGAAITSGESNVAIGNGAMVTNATSDDNVAIGKDALATHDVDGEGGNTAIGYSAGMALTTGTLNTIIGSRAAVSLLTGAYNICIGYGAMDAADGAESYNIAIGRNALGTLNHDSSVSNVAIGDGALGATSTNVATQNIAIGRNAGGGVTSGDLNTFVGHSAGSVIETGVRNTLIGADTAADDSSRNDVVCVGVGVGGDSATINIGTSSTSKIWVDNDSTSWANASDERIKKDIEDCDLGLAFINDLRPVTFKWRAYEDWDEELKEEGMTKPGINTEKLNYGFVAQEVKATMESHNHPKFPAWGYSNRKTGEQSLSKGNFITPLINAVQELSAANDSLKTRIEELEG